MNTRPWVYILQHVAIESPGIIELALKVHGISARVILSSEGEAVPTELGEAAGLLVMGGPLSIAERERYPFLQAELRLIESAISARKPVLGICFGSQLIATALGASVRKGRGKEIGWHPVTLTPEARTDALWQTAPSSFMGFHWHGDFFELPQQAVPLATSDLAPFQAFRYGDAVYALLFHLEVTSSIIQDMVSAFTDDQREVGLTAEDILSQTTNYLPALQMIGSSVFLAWANRVSSANLS